MIQCSELGVKHMSMCLVFFRNDANVGRLKLLTNVKRKIQKCFSMSLSFGNKNNLASCSPPRMIPML